MWLVGGSGGGFGSGYFVSDWGDFVLVGDGVGVWVGVCGCVFGCGFGVG